MTQSPKTAHDDPVGRDDNQAWDYVARWACPPTHDAEDPREQLAVTLIDALAPDATPDQYRRVCAMAEALMGTVWVNLYTRNGPPK